MTKLKLTLNMHPDSKTTKTDLILSGSAQNYENSTCLQYLEIAFYLCFRPYF